MHTKMYTVLFWSGGKDSLLARHFLEVPPEKLVLLTTFNEEERIVPHQNIPLSYIQEQAVALGHTLTTVPLPHPCSNEIYLERLFAVLGSLPFDVDSFAFGDWHLEDIRKWREKVFGERGFTCRFPIWHKPLDDLITTLEEHGQKIVISSVNTDFKDMISTGDIYNREFIENLPDKIDPMGEYGEFHTRVVV